MAYLKKYTWVKTMKWNIKGSHLCFANIAYSPYHDPKSYGRHSRVETLSAKRCVNLVPTKRLWEITWYVYSHHERRQHLLNITQLTKPINDKTQCLWYVFAHQQTEHRWASDSLGALVSRTIDSNGSWSSHSTGQPRHAAAPDYWRAHWP